VRGAGVSPVHSASRDGHQPNAAMFCRLGSDDIPEFVGRPVDRCCRKRWRWFWRRRSRGICRVVRAGHLGISTDTDLMFAESLPWRQRAMTFRDDFPQYRDLLVRLSTPASRRRRTNCRGTRRRARAGSCSFSDRAPPDASPFLHQEGLLFLDPTSSKRCSNRNDRCPAIHRRASQRSRRSRAVRRSGLVGNRG